MESKQDLACDFTHPCHQLYFISEGVAAGAGIRRPRAGFLERSKAPFPGIPDSPVGCSKELLWEERQAGQGAGVGVGRKVQGTTL